MRTTKSYVAAVAVAFVASCAMGIAAQSPNPLSTVASGCCESGHRRYAWAIQTSAGIMADHCAQAVALAQNAPKAP